MPTSAFDLTGKVVMATGANSGIGLGFVTGCAKQGANVVIWDREPSRHLNARSTLEAAGAGGVHIETVDVTDEAAVDASFASTLEVTGRVHCVFANAGIASRASSFPDMTSEMYHGLLNVSFAWSVLYPASGK